jgi:hypothetical protein
MLDSTTLADTVISGELSDKVSVLKLMKVLRLLVAG